MAVKTRRSGNKKAEKREANKENVNPSSTETTSTTKTSGEAAASTQPLGTSTNAPESIVDWPASSPRASEEPSADSQPRDLDEDPASAEETPSNSEPDDADHSSDGPSSNADESAARGRQPGARSWQPWEDRQVAIQVEILRPWTGEHGLERDVWVMAAQRIREANPAFQRSGLATRRRWHSMLDSHKVCLANTFLPSQKSKAVFI
jgi:hypothetical protein